MPLIRALDVSGIFHPIWRVKEAKGEPIGSATAETIQTLRERAEARGADYVVACCDSGRSFRHAIGLEWQATHPDYRGYKGHRPAKDPAMMAALDRVIDELVADGVPVLRAAGFEADDVIATVTEWAIREGHDVEIATEDKDLMQLVRDGARRVTVVRRGGEVFGPAEVTAKFGVPPEKLGEYLAIVGDSSDHVPGVRGFGDKAARAIITEYGGFAAAVKAAREEAELVARGAIGDAYEPRFTPAQRAKLIDGEAAFLLSLRLTTLRADVPVDLAIVTAPRVPKTRTTNEWKEQRQKAANINAHIEEETEEEAPMSDENTAQSNDIVNAPVVIQPPAAVAAPDPAPVVQSPPSVNGSAHPSAQSAALALPKPQATKRAPRSYEMELEPRSYEEAMLVAEHAADSGLFKDIRTPAQAIMMFQLGRKFGLSAVDSLRMIHMIEGKPSMSAQLIVGIVKKSGMAEYFEIEALENTHATWVTKRRGDRREVRWTFSVEDAKAAKLGGFGSKEAPANGFKADSNWAKHPKVMCMWRAAVFLARAVYTDLVGGLYTPDEIGDVEMEIDGNPPTFGELVAA